MDKQRDLEQLFRLAQQDQTVQSFEQTKDRFVSSVSGHSVNKARTKQLLTKKWIIMLTTISTIGLSFILLLGNGTNTPSKSTDKNSTVQTIPTRNTPEKPTPGDLPAPPHPVPFQQPVSLITSMQELTLETPLATSDNPLQTPAYDSHSLQPTPPKLWDEPFQFPVLTEEEINITRKKKKAMLKALAKHDKNAYAFIPSGSFDYNGQTISVQAFYMGTTEVTNFEYRTFLFDLILQGKKDQFLKAKPDQSQWNKIDGEQHQPFVEHYFSHPVYNDYPVVNVSREGAELYCKWLSEEVRKYVGDTRESKYNDVRLPLRAEWVKAASNEGKNLPYPWGGPYTRNSKGFILANYLRPGEEALQSTQGTKAFDITAPSKSYWPTENGLYNVSGNVAEMVYEGMNQSEPGTAGGSWKNTVEEIQILAPDPYRGITEGRPTIGFRVVSTYLILDRKEVQEKP